MKFDRFKHHATLSRFARQLEGRADHAASIQLLETQADRYELKSLLHPADNAGEWVTFFSEIITELNTSPLAAALLRRGIKKGWAIGLTGQSMDYFYALDAQNRTIVIDHGGFAPQALRRSAHCREALVGSLIRALRDIGHETRLGAYEVSLRPDAVLMMERARSADIEAVTVMIAWELRSAGYPALWRHLLGSEDGDVALTFGYTIEKTPKSLYDGKALGSAFLRWYADAARVNGCDHVTLEMLDQLLIESGDAVSWGKGSFTPEDARDLSILPDGLAYLKEEAQQVAGAPEFLTLGDPVNEAHLFQISYDLAVVRVAGVPFRTASLARLIFPTAP